MLIAKGFPCGVIQLLEPSLLWWSAAMAIPLTIPWLVLRAPHSTRFAAVELLLLARSRQPFLQRLVRSAGPLLRACMVAILAIALARPQVTVSPDAMAPAPGVDGHVVFLTDDAPGPADGAGSTPPLMAAVMATSPLECRLFGSAQRSEGMDTLAGARAVVLCDPAAIDAVDRERMAGFVEHGGTAIVLLGPVSMSASNAASTTALVRRLGGTASADVSPFDDAVDRPNGTSPASHVPPLATVEFVSGRTRGDEGVTAPTATAGFADVFVPFDGPSIRRFVRLDGKRVAAAERDRDRAVIARLRMASGFETLGTMVRRGDGLVAFMGIPFDLPGIADGSWQSADTPVAWDDIAAWPGFVDVVRRVFVPILEASPGREAVATTHGGSSVPPIDGFKLAGTLLVLAIALAAIDPLCALWPRGARTR